MPEKPNLEQLVKDIQQAATDSGLEIIRGLVELPNDATTIVYENDLSGCYKVFLQQAKRIGCSFIVLYVERLEQTELDEAFELANEAEESEGRTSILGTLEECKASIGEIGLISLKYLVPGTAVCAEAISSADWHRVVHDTEEMLNETDGDDGNGNDRRLTDDQIEVFARELAVMPRFKIAKNKTARTFEAKKHLRGKLDATRWPFYSEQIVQMAKNIYETEIKPASDAELTEKARALLREGSTRQEIARYLGITANQLQKLI